MQRVIEGILYLNRSGWAWRTRPRGFPPWATVRYDERRFEVLPRLWVVERTFAWLGRKRRPSNGYENHPGSGNVTIRITLLHRLPRRSRRPANSLVS